MKTSFKRESKISSCHIDKQTVAYVERYLTEDVPQIIGIELKDPSLNVHITDSDGEQILPSITAYQYDKLPDTTKSISLSYGESYYTNSVNVNFTSDIVGAKITINIFCESSKEKSHAILNGITNILKPCKTFNYLFHPHPFLQGALTTLVPTMWGISFMYLGNKVYQVIDLALSHSIPCVISILLTIYVITGWKLKPSITFDTARQARINRMTHFLFYSFLGFILFTLIGVVIIRKKLFGF